MNINQAKRRPKVRHFIYEWRKHRGLSQEALAEKVGTTASAISQLETGKQGYSQPMLEALAGALETDPGSLLTTDPRDPQGILAAWEALPPEERRRAITILRALAQAPVG